jgi:PAS domain
MPFRDLLEDARLTRFYDHWEALRAGRPMPARRDLDPADIKDLLPHLAIVQVAGSRFLFRLVGTEVADRMGVNPTGRFLDELDPRGGYRAFITQVFETVRDRRLSVLSQTDYDDLRTGRHIRRLSVPFSDDGVAVSHIVSLMLFSWPKGAAPVIVGDGDAPSVEHRIAGMDHGRQPRPGDLVDTP